MHAASQQGSISTTSENTDTVAFVDDVHLHGCLLKRFLGTIKMPKTILTDINNKCQIEILVDTKKRMTVYFIYVNGKVQPPIKP
jgi:hypothetical protein